MNRLWKYDAVNTMAKPQHLQALLWVNYLTGASRRSLTGLLLCRKHKRRDEVTEQHISLLLNCGLLTRHLTQKDTYWFALAGIGPLIKSLVKGRKV